MSLKEFKLLEYFILNGNIGISQRKISEDLDISLGIVNKTIKLFEALGYIVNSKLQSKAFEKYEEFKVKSAIILAAGKSLRFVPFSLEKPKALFEVRGEVLIERQINQLIAAGIKDIYIVIGYMKELFYYLKKKYGVHLIYNDEFENKNNIFSIIKAKSFISNSYICSSDNYFIENPFNSHEFKAFYSSSYISGETDEYTMQFTKNNKIKSVIIGGRDSWIMTGHAYWDKKFSKVFFDIISRVHSNSIYSQNVWELILVDFIKEFDIIVKKYEDNIIYEFDSYRELLIFDRNFINRFDSKILSNIAGVFKCDKNRILNFSKMNGGLTNESFKFEYDTQFYIYRIPGLGTEEIINRHNEYKSLQIAYDLNIDTTLVHMDPNEGWKISKFIPEAHELDYTNEIDVHNALRTIKVLHKSEIKVDWEFNVISEIFKMESLILSRDRILIPYYEVLKARIIEIHQKLEELNYAKVFVHNDFYDPNILITKNSIVIIDWEYAGLGYPAYDIGTFICCSPYDYEKSIEIIKFYLAEEWSKQKESFYVGYVSIMGFYWLVWALLKESNGDQLGEYVQMWHRFADEYSLNFKNNY